jgi:hypothetical protein
MNEYYERVEKHWKEEEASRFIKTIPQGYQRSLIKKYVCEEFCIN